MRTRVTFDGHELTQLCYVSKLRTSALPREVSTQDVPGRDGSLVTGARLTARTITMRLTVRAKDPTERQMALRNLAAILAVDEPRPLAISIDGGLYYMAMPTSKPVADRYRTHTSFEVEFLVPDPTARGEARTITVPSGGSVTFNVGGTYPTMPVVTVASAHNPSSGPWKLTLDGGDFLAAALTATSAVVADCEARTLTVNGATKLLQPEADWLVLAPGSHTLQMAGTGTATVAFDERWL